MTKELTPPQRALLDHLRPGREYTHADMFNTVRARSDEAFSQAEIERAARSLCTRKLMLSSKVTNGISVFMVPKGEKA